MREDTWERLQRKMLPNKHHTNLGKAIEDAALTYRKYTAGEEIDNDPLPGPLEKAGNAIGSLLGQKKNKAAVQLRTK